MIECRGRREKRGGNRFEFLCYHGPRKRLALELEGQSDAQTLQEERVRVMDTTNPRVILRNYIAQNAIEAAENGDFSEVSPGYEFLSGFLYFISPPHTHTLHCHSFISGYGHLLLCPAGPAGPQSSGEAVQFAARPGVSSVGGQQRRGCESGRKT